MELLSRFDHSPRTRNLLNIEAKRPGTLANNILSSMRLNCCIAVAWCLLGSCPRDDRCYPPLVFQ